MKHIKLLVAVLLPLGTLASPASAAPVPCGGPCAFGTEYCDTSTDTCTSCTPCGAGTFEEGACGGADGNTDTVCGSCPANCLSCNDAITCNSCAPESWFVFNPIGGGAECRACTQCDLDETEVVTCDFGHDRQCMPTSSGCDDANCASCSGSGPGQCTTCASGYYLASGACVACTSCSAGSRVETECSASADTVCTACGPGTYSDGSDAASCTMCAANTFQASSSATGCEACPSGKTSSAGQNQCSCPAGTMDVDGSCTLTCPAGKYPMDGSCVDCPAGSFSGAGATACTACAPGTYADQAGSTACTHCPVQVAGTDITHGSVSASAGATACMACDGYSLPNDARTTCVPCPEGMHVEALRCVTTIPNDVGCSTAGASNPALAWFALPLALVAFAWRRRSVA